MILITGATGTTGSELVRRLSTRGVKVRGLTRSLAKAAALSSLPNVEMMEGDLEHPETLDGPLHGVERAMLISSSDARMLEVQSNFPVLCRSSTRRFGLHGCMVRLNGGLRHRD